MVAIPADLVESGDVAALPTISRIDVPQIGRLGLSTVSSAEELFGGTRLRVERG